MSENQEANFVAYEYLNVIVKPEYEPLYSDCYANFGWQQVDSGYVNRAVPGVNSGYSIPSVSGIDASKLMLKFKRDKAIKNRSQLLPLQRKCESALTEIDRLERGKESRATAVSLITGGTGVAFLGAGAFSYFKGIIPLFGVLTVVGLVGCNVSYLVYKSIKNKRTAELSLRIDEQYDFINSISEQAKALWA